MPAYSKPDPENSAKAILAELAVEGTSSLVEAHRVLLDLAQQENDLMFKGLKSQLSGFVPAEAMADFVRRSVDALVEMQQELLTNGSKQAVTWMQPQGNAKDMAAQLLDFARDGVEAFARAQKALLDAVSEKSSKAMSGRTGQNGEVKDGPEIKELAHDAGLAFIKAQQRLLELTNQQMNMNLQAATRTSSLVSPAQLIPLTSLASETIKSFVDAEAALLGSLVKPHHAKAAARTSRRATKPKKARRRKAAAKTEKSVAV